MPVTTNAGTATKRAGRYINFETIVIAIFVVLKLIYMSRSVFGTGRIGPRILEGNDSGLYMQSANASIFSKTFYAARGPLGYPLLIKLLFHNLRAIIVAQSIISIASWTLMARAMAAIPSRRWLGKGLMAALLAIALSAPALIWDAGILTESLSVSLFVLMLGLGIQLVTEPRRYSFGLFILATAYAAVTRDTNAMFAAVFGFAAIVGLVLRRGPRRKLMILAVVGLASATIAMTFSAMAQRSYWPLNETITIRIVGDPDARQEFVRAGMPNDYATDLLNRDYGVYSDAFVGNDPIFRPLRTWIDRKGRTTYVKYLLTHPRYVVTKPWPQRDFLLSPQFVSLANYFGMTPDTITSTIGGFGSPNLPRVFEWWLAIVILGLGAVVVRSRGRALFVRSLIFGLLLFVIPHALLVYHADALEIGRHSVTLSVQAHIAAWVASAIVVDQVMNLFTRGQPRKARL